MPKQEFRVHVPCGEAFASNIDVEPCNDDEYLRAMADHKAECGPGRFKVVTEDEAF